MVKEPHLFIYLKTSTGNLLKRIQRRGRDYEKSIDASYLDTLTYFYDMFFDKIQTECVNSKVIIIDTDNYDAEQIHKIVLRYLEK